MHTKSSGQPSKISSHKRAFDLWRRVSQLKGNERKVWNYLYEHRGNICEYQALHASVFPEYRQSENTIERRLEEHSYIELVYQWITRLREKVERDPNHPEYILTERGIGYRYSGPIRRPFPIAVIVACTGLYCLCLFLLFTPLKSEIGCDLMGMIPGRRCFLVYGHFFPSGYMGDIGGIKQTLIPTFVFPGIEWVTRVRYIPSGHGPDWIGIVWQHPANNWATLKSGYDMQGFRYVTFYAKSDKPQYPVTFWIGGSGWFPGTCDPDPGALYQESICPAISVTCNLANVWLKFAIPIPEGSDLHQVASGFAWIVSEPGTVYLRDIFWEERPAQFPWSTPLICSP